MAGEAACSQHPERSSVGTCARCGRFTCEACAKSSPCLECQVIQRDASRPLSPVLDWLIGICCFLYAVCTVVTVPALGQLNIVKFDKQTLFSGPMLGFLGLQTVYSTVWSVLMVAYLIWYCMLIDWARGRGIATPNKFVAVVCCFVPFVNFFYPWLALRRIQRESRVNTPVGWWWALTWASVILGGVGLARIWRGGYDAIFTLASVLEVVAILLCWQIARDFRIADERWKPREALAQRG